jgi:hypothetical protein
LTVSTNAPSWSISGEPSWCDIKKTDAAFILSPKTNPTTDARNAVLVITAGDQSKKVQIFQKGISFLEKGNWKQAINKVLYNGAINYSDGAYKGERSGNWRNGLGVYFFTTENQSYWGDFLRGESSGKGLYIIGKDGDISFSGCRNCKYYAGNWASDWKNGIGKCYDSTGKLLLFSAMGHPKLFSFFPTCDHVVQFLLLAIHSKYFRFSKS